MGADTKTEKLKIIRDELLVSSDSPLYEYRKNNGYFPVVGQGDHNARIMFVGEAPGRNEAQSGRPFCGAAGKILDQLLASIGLPRESVYITNIVKDRPPENRDPLPEEIAYYAPLLRRQIEIIQPAVIATLGRFSMDFIVSNYSSAAPQSISTVHGTIIEGEHTPSNSVALIPLYHPAAAIYNRVLMDTLFKDFELLKKFLD